MLCVPQFFEHQFIPNVHYVSVETVMEVPACNTSWNDEYVRQYASADISVAVNTDRGLITPIVFGAESKAITDISSDVKTLAGKAKDCLLYTSPSPRDYAASRMPSSA